MHFSSSYGLFVLPQKLTIGPFFVTMDLSITITMARTLNLSKLFTAGPPPGAVLSCVTSAAEVGASSRGQPAGSNWRLPATLATVRAVSLKPGSCSFQDPRLSVFPLPLDGGGRGWGCRPVAYPGPASPPHPH